MEKNYFWRVYFIIAILALALIGIISRMFYLGILKRQFLVTESAIRSIRTVDIQGHRGMIFDRHGVPLAVSTEVDSFWVNPESFALDKTQAIALSKLLDMDVSSLKNKIDSNQNHEFVYLKRHVSPDIAAKIKLLNIPNLFIQKEYQRFYPEGEVTAHVIGFTDVDENGKEGVELAYNSWLTGTKGKKEVIKDRLGNIVSELKTLSEPVPGNDLTLSIDSNIQYLAYRALKDTIDKYHAESGSAVVMDVNTGEVLAMVNQPSYNPNARNGDIGSAIRNRAVTDLFEPGSTLKSFSIANALESGKYTPLSRINTHPGWFLIDGKKVQDVEFAPGNFSVTEILQKSSNVGVAKITLSLPPDTLLNILRRVGFGTTTGSGFPGEANGIMPDEVKNRPFVLATLSFGYDISVTALQLARAYTVLASKGKLLPATFLKTTNPPPGKQVIDEKITTTMLAMLESVLDIGGTGTRGRIVGYHIAGKTGTANIAGKHGYEKKDKFTAAFAGIAPVQSPRLVTVVVIRNPKGEHMGGLVAAPAFAKIMEGALRVLNIPPDAT